MSMRTLFKLFCWPPCVFCRPSIVAARLSLNPPAPSYDIEESSDGYGYRLSLKSTSSEDAMVLRFTVCCYGLTERGNSIVCLFYHCGSTNAKYTLLYSHGNGVDIGDELRILFELGRSVNCDVLAYDYSGYGRSSGRPSEANLYADIACALGVLNSDFGVPPERVILVGRSIGSVPTVDLASKVKVAGVVLLCPLASALRTAFPIIRSNTFCDAYRNISKIPKVTAPVLVIHGTEDEIIDISQAFELHSKCHRAVVPLWVEGVGHNDLQLVHFVSRLRRFVFHEVDGRSS